VNLKYINNDIKIIYHRDKLVSDVMATGWTNRLQSPTGEKVLLFEIASKSILGFIQALIERVIWKL
jgi:hypothetical protein